MQGIEKLEAVGRSKIDVTTLGNSNDITVWPYEYINVSFSHFAEDIDNINISKYI